MFYFSEFAVDGVLGKPWLRSIQYAAEALKAYNCAGARLRQVERLTVTSYNCELSLRRMVEWNRVVQRYAWREGVDVGALKNAWKQGIFGVL